jgi:hypothetical protein
MVSFSPELGGLLLKYGATISVTFDGAESSSVVTILATENKAEVQMTLAQFVRLNQTEASKRALDERKASVVSRITTLGGEAPDLSSVGDETSLNDWVAAQPAATLGALRMNSDNFRAFMRAQNQPAQVQAPASGLEAARAALQAAQTSAGKVPASNPSGVGKPSGKPGGK